MIYEACLGTQQKISPFVHQEAGPPPLVQLWILKQPCNLDPNLLSSGPGTVLPTQGPGGRQAHLCPWKQACRLGPGCGPKWTDDSSSCAQLWSEASSAHRDMSSGLVGAIPIREPGNRPAVCGPTVDPDADSCPSTRLTKVLEYHLPRGQTGSMPTRALGNRPTYYRPYCGPRSCHVIPCYCQQHCFSSHLNSSSEARAFRLNLELSGKIKDETESSRHDGWDYILSHRILLTKNNTSF